MQQIVLWIAFILMGCSSSSESRLSSFDRIEYVDALVKPGNLKPGNQTINRLIEQVNTEVHDTKIVGTIPLEVNEMVEKWLTYYTTRGKDRLQAAFERASYYMPMIQQELVSMGIPKEIANLPYIESEFKSAATSRVGAGGMWQFMPATAERFKLHRNNSIDERRDPIRSTEAAARYLKDIYNVFGSWYLALAAYNAGEFRIMNVIMASKSRDFWKLAESKYLPRETMNYVPKFIAVCIIADQPEKFGFKVSKHAKPLTKENLVLKPVPSRTTLASVSSSLNIPLDTLSHYNSHVSSKLIDSGRKTYPLWIPKEFESLYAANESKLRSIPKVKTYVASGKSYKVRRGDSLFAIAKKHGVTVTELRRINNLKSTRIYPGQTLNLSRALAKNYRVRRGDNLAKIARKFGTSINNIKKVNRLTKNTIYIGQLLKL